MSFQAKEYLLPCLNKKLFGFDCLGCGLQRSVLHVLKGEFGEAFKIYPAIFTLILLALFILINWKYSFKNGRKIILTLAAINILIIVVSYIIKMNQLF
jgi:hypothetical protein